MLKVTRSKKELHEALSVLRSSGKTIALVPTMGALHEGHISLVNLARKHADTVIVSIFVNPTQFGPDEDFSRYPRTEVEDLQKLEKANCDVAYIPTVEEMYGKHAATVVHVKGISDELCGAFRPGHFDGVATVVTKLFMQVMPDIAVFGEKDYQQLHIIRQFTRDLDIPVRIIGGPILREEDGLALSSRNRYLDGKERRTAALLYKALIEVAEKLKSGQGIEDVIFQAKHSLMVAGFTKVDYIEVRDAVTLFRIDALDRPARLLAAVYLGKTRLIDNIAI